MIKFIKEYFKKPGWWKPLIKIGIILVVVAAVGTGGFFVLKSMGFTSKEEFEALRDRLGDSWEFWAIIAGLQLFQSLCIPISNQLITIPCALIFGNQLWKVWLVSWIAIWVSTLISYAVGRFAGKKLLNWILRDKEQTERCTNWLKRGWVYYPLGMLLPLPDNMVTLLTGTAKMNFWFVAGCALLTRAIDIACSVWGWGYITKYWWGWVLLVIGVILLFLSTYVLYKIEKKRETNERK